MPKYSNIPFHENPPNTGLANEFYIKQTHAIPHFNFLPHYHEKIEISSPGPGASGNILIDGAVHIIEPHYIYTAGPGSVHAYDLKINIHEPFVVVIIQTGSIASILHRFGMADVQTAYDALGHLPAVLNDRSLRIRTAMIALASGYICKEGKDFTCGSVKSPIESHTAATDAAALWTIFAELLAPRDPAIKGGPPLLKGGPPSLVRRVIDAVEKLYTQPVSLREIACDAASSVSRMSHLFKKTTGMTVLDFLNQKRIEHAKRLLAQSDRSISSIAVECGFESFSYFSQVFRKYCGCSPREWARNEKLTKE
jgi:AraC-like DNA-binding protein